MTKQKNIRIQRSCIFSDIEAIYSDLEPSCAYKIQLPNSLSHSGAFGIEGALLQLYCTAMRRASHLSIHTHVNSATDGRYYEDICNHLLGLCALRLSDQILTNNKTVVDIKVALSPSISIFSDIRRERFATAFKGPYLALPAVKSAAKKGAKGGELLMPFYNERDLVSASRFRQITCRAIESIYPMLKTYDLGSRREIHNLSEIIRELFSNTHRHARTDSKGNLYEKNLRAVTYRVDSLTKERMQEISRSGGGSLAKFISWWLPSEHKVFNALDITIIDAGPGLARRWTGLDKEMIDSDMEKDAILECFKKHTSSAVEEASGSGLSNVLKDLKQLNGWMRLRTGRTLVEKTFFNYEGSASIAKKDIKVMDNFVEGALFNIIIPISSLKVVM